MKRKTENPPASSKNAAAAAEASLLRAQLADVQLDNERLRSFLKRAESFLLALNTTVSTLPKKITFWWIVTHVEEVIKLIKTIVGIVKDFFGTNYTIKSDPA